MSEHPVKDQIFISKLTKIILANLGNENFGVNELAKEAGISHYSLNRRLQAILNKSIKKFIREVRLQKALEMLQNEEVTVSDVAYKVGFGSPAYFNTRFHEFFGYPPGAVKKGDFVSTTKTETFEIQHKKHVNRILLFIFSGIIIIVVLGYLVYKLGFGKSIIDSGGHMNKPEKSIAVLPFKNLSDSSSNQYFIDGLMEEILANLSKIRDLRVVSRASVEPYRGTYSSSEIANKLKVDYFVEGSGQKYGNSFRIRVQLIEATSDKHIWTESYEQEIKEMKDIFGIQSSIAQSIAEELREVITPEEKQLIEKTPTTDLTAYDFYRKGREEYIKYRINGRKREELQKAEELFNQALQYDPTYAVAYTGLAWVYWDKHYYLDYLSKNFMDSVPILCNIALSFDNQLSEAHTLMGTYYSQIGKWDLAADEFEKAIQFNPNDWMAYCGKAEFYYETDWINCIKYYTEALSINRGPEITDLFSKLAYAYASAGFPEKARQYIQDKLKLDSDSAGYYAESSRFEFWLGNYNKSLEYSDKGFKIDSTNLVILTFLADSYGWLGQFEKSLKCWERYIEVLESQGDAEAMHHMNRIGYILWQNGYKEEAEKYFNDQIKYCESSIEFGRHYENMLYTYYDLAGVYAFKGERDKAYENLHKFNKKPMMSLWMVTLIKTDPLFNSIRNESEFQKIVKDVEAKYQAEHERVRKWLEEQGMLQNPDGF